MTGDFGVACSARDQLDHFNEALLTVTGHFVDGHDLIPGFQPGRLGPATG